MGPTEIALVQLLAYLSSCCNPITYCFMNEKFRNAFLSAFGCGPQGRGFGRGPNRSTDMLSASFNDSFNLGRRSVKGKENSGIACGFSSLLICRSESLTTPLTAAADYFAWYTH